MSRKYGKKPTTQKAYTITDNLLFLCITLVGAGIVCLLYLVILSAFSLAEQALHYMMAQVTSYNGPTR
jgi:hypothetical protein